MSRLGVARGMLFVLVLAFLPAVVHQHWLLNIGIFTLMFAGLASSWNLVGGFAGYPSLGHAAFFGIGAYAVALIFENGVGSGYGPFLILPLIGVAVGVASLPIGYVAMRTRADTFAIVTITLLFVVQTLAYNLRWLTGGAQGASLPAPPFPLATFERPFYYAFLVLLCLAMLVSWATANSRVGLGLSAVRGDEDKARGVGVPVTAVKLSAFAVSVAFAAMIGGVWAYYVAFIYPQYAVDPLITIGMVLMAFLGGRGTVWGPVLGAFILTPGQQYLAYQLGGNQFYLIGYAAIFLVVIILLPRGILPSLTDRRQAGRRRAFLAEQPEPALIEAAKVVAP